MTKRPISLLAWAALLLLAQALPAATWNTNAEGVVLDGYDVVAYRAHDRAEPGSPRHAAEYDGATFYFANAERRALFLQEPERYVPEYHEFCVFAVGARNARVPANPDSFKLYNGELLVFFNDEYEGRKFNTKILWSADERALCR